MTEVLFWLRIPFVLLVLALAAYAVALERRSG